MAKQKNKKRKSRKAKVQEFTLTTGNIRQVLNSLPPLIRTDYQKILFLTDFCVRVVTNDGSRNVYGNCRMYLDQVWEGNHDIKYNEAEPVEFVCTKFPAHQHYYDKISRILPRTNMADRLATVYYAIEALCDRVTQIENPGVKGDWIKNPMKSKGIALYALDKLTDY